MHQIALRFQSSSGRIDGHHVTARGLHGLLYHVLKQADPSKATWLHGHSVPKPYTIAPYYDTHHGTLAGVRLTALTDDTAALFLQAWRGAQQTGAELHLGHQPFQVVNVEAIPGPDFSRLAMATPAPRVGLHFLSPTSFRQGPGDLPLPLPANVFRGPFQAWQAFAPSHLQLPGDWLSWCEENVFVARHKIETVEVTISKREPPFAGFVGEVWFEALDDAVLYQSVLQALATLATYAGVGRKTTMGMGAVECISTSDEQNRRTG